MIPCIAVDASNRPGDFPLSKWIKKNEQYHITWVVHVKPQNELAFSLYEKPLGKECYPYEYFLAKRFAVRPEDVEALREMFTLENDVGEDMMKEIFENSNIEIAV